MKLDRNIRNVGLLSVCMAFAQTQMVLMFSASTLIGKELGPSLWMATIPITLQFVTMTLSTVPAAYLMKRIGRARGFIAFLFVGSTGAALIIYSLYEQSFVLFCAGSALFGCSAGSNQQFRFAAVDTAPDDFKSRAVSLVLAGGVFAGLAGPSLSTWSHDMMAPVIWAGIFVVMLAMQGLMVVALLFTDIPQPTQKEMNGPVRPMAEIARQPKFILALLSAMVGYGVMNLVMLSTPLFMTTHPTHPFAIPEVNSVIMWHVVGMFAPSFVTGWLINRYGDINIITAGACLAFVCVAVNLSGDSFWHIATSMALVGVAWNFMFTGGTTLLLGTYAPAEKAQVQGINDFFVFGTVAVCSSVAGAIYQFAGWHALNIAVVIALAIVLSANLWFRLRRQPVAAE
jgi:predicted MFS family arabinose efflux permease